MFVIMSEGIKKSARFSEKLVSRGSPGLLVATHLETETLIDGENGGMEDEQRIDMYAPTMEHF